MPEQAWTVIASVASYVIGLLTMIFNQRHERKMLGLAGDKESAARTEGAQLEQRKATRAAELKAVDELLRHFLHADARTPADPVALQYVTSAYIRQFLTEVDATLVSAGGFDSSSDERPPLFDVLWLIDSCRHEAREALGTVLRGELVPELTTKASALAKYAEESAKELESAGLDHAAWSMNQRVRKLRSFGKAPKEVSKPT